MSDNKAGWRQKALFGVMLVGAVALVARVSYELLAPLVPWLITAVTLAVIYALIVGKFRR